MQKSNNGMLLHEDTKTDSGNVHLHWFGAWSTSVWDNLSVHIRRPAASSYWKSNWWDTCIFELNELGLSIHSFWVGVPLLGSGNKLVGYVYFRIKWARLYTITHSESEWSRRGAISDLTNVRLRIFNSASVDTYSDYNYYLTVTVMSECRFRLHEFDAKCSL